MKKIAPQKKKNIKKNKNEILLYRKLALARGYARCNFCITFLQYYCSLYVLSTIYLENKNKKNWQIFVWPFFENYMVAPSLTKNTMMME